MIWTSHSSVWRVHHQQGLYPYHLNPVQELKPEDHRARHVYCRWLLQITGDQPDFLNHVLWTDESGFTQDSIVNLYNLHIYSDENLRVTHSSSFQQMFNVNVWDGILGITLIGPFIIEERMRGEDYLNFIEDVVMPMLDDMPLQSMVSTRRCSITFHASSTPMVISPFFR